MATSTNGADHQPDTPPTAAAGNEFETVQRDVFEAVDLDSKSRDVALEEPRIQIRVIGAGDLKSEEVPIVFVHGGS